MPLSRASGRVRERGEGVRVGKLGREDSETVGELMRQTLILLVGQREELSGESGGLPAGDGGWPHRNRRSEVTTCVTIVKNNQLLLKPIPPKQEEPGHENLSPQQLHIKGQKDTTNMYNYAGSFESHAQSTSCSIS